tara:strand:- start:72 stop:695 length:624 start_codon:yes stop_codon:yes gene_type:complete
LKKNLNIVAYCSIKNNTIKLNNITRIAKDQKLSFLEFTKQVYKEQGINYPKFFKMDNLCKLAFLAAEILCNNDIIKAEDKEQMAIVLSNRSSSLDTDKKHQDTIADSINYYPSPAIFLYTLPNITIGEISIKHKIKGENAFFVLDKFNAEILMQYATSLVQSKKSNHVLCGWVDYDDGKYHAFMYIVTENGSYKQTQEFINKIFKES